MQTMQQLVAAGNRVAAPGILTLGQFRQQDSLQGWARARVEERLRHDHGLRYAAADIMIHVVHSRQAGPQLNPFHPSSYVTWRGFQHVGGQMIELIRELPATRAGIAQRGLVRLRLLAHRPDNPPSRQAITRGTEPGLHQGDDQAPECRWQLSCLPENPIDRFPGRGWRLNAHALVNRARMCAEAAKARYAGHLARNPDERAYRWVRQVLDYPHNALRPRWTDNASPCAN